MANKGPGCCGPVQDRARMLKQVARATSQAHMMMAGMFDVFAKDFPEEASEMKAQADKQRRLEKESLEIALPNDVEPEDDEVAV